MILVIAEVQPNTLYMDEDDAVYTLGAPLGRLSDHEFSVGCAFIAAKSEVSAWQEAVDTYRATYVQDCTERFESKFQARGGNMHEDLKERLRGLLKEMWFPALSRLAAHMVSDHYWIQCWGQVMGNEPRPERAEYVPSVGEAETAYREHVEQVTRTLKLLARPKPERPYFNETARVTTPIGYSGANHIVAVLEIRDGDAYREEKGPDGKREWKPTPVVVHYGSVPEKFKQDFAKQRGEFEVVTPSEKTAREKEIEADNADYDEEGYWAGEGNSASGVLPVARDTHRICLAWRSEDVHTGDCFGSVGGAVKDGKTPAESAASELKEEVGYSGPLELHAGWTFRDKKFSYFNFIGLVDHEFSFKPGPAHAWETDRITWETLDDIKADMEENPGDYHPGLIDLFKNSAEVIERAVKGELKAKTASPLPHEVSNTPAFQRWFSGSKVVDDKGAPLRVYHATRKDFTEFKTEPNKTRSADVFDSIGAWFSQEPYLSNTVFELESERNPKKTGWRTMPCYVAIRKPLEVEHRMTLETAVARLMKWRMERLQEEFEKDPIKAARTIKATLKAKGYDGIHVEDDLGYGESWVAFAPSQVKSAIGNNGEFSTKATSIVAAGLRKNASSTALLDWRTPTEGGTVTLRSLAAADLRSAETILRIIQSRCEIEEGQLDKDKTVRVRWVSPDAYDAEPLHWRHEGVKEKADEIARAMGRGTKFVPAVFFQREWMDGNHRVKAARSIGLPTIPAVDMRGFLPDFDEGYEDERRAKREQKRRERDKAFAEEFDKEFGQEKTAATPPTQMMYHISRGKNRRSIRKYGLLPQTKEFVDVERKPGVYLLETEEQAAEWAYWFGFCEPNPTIMDIWEVTLPEGTDVTSDPSTDMCDAYDSWIAYQAIPPKNIRLVKSIGPRYPDDVRPPHALKVDRDKTAVLSKNPAGKPDANYIEGSNGWALYPDQRAGAYVPSPIREMLPPQLNDDPSPEEAWKEL
jgi:8-oxo-dGTP pyrophosphatase MutT (NUDIX family)